MHTGNARHTEYKGDTAQQGVTQQAKGRVGFVWVFTLALVFSVVFMSAIQVFVGRIYMVPSASMEPTLHGCQDCGDVNDRIVVEKLSYVFSDPQPGDIVVFEAEPSWENSQVAVASQHMNPFRRGLKRIAAGVGATSSEHNLFVKRIVAVGGDVAECVAARSGSTTLLINSEATTKWSSCGSKPYGPVLVPEGRLLLMGDNRDNSLDSRAHIGDQWQGTISEEAVRGKDVGIVLPLNRLGGVD